MSKQFDVKRAILKLIENPEDKDAAVEILLHAIDCDEEDFEYENDETPEQYLFG
ncbi:hypothetical protein VPHK71_0023 [Vibrio phage K71]